MIYTSSHMASYDASYLSRSSPCWSDEFHRYAESCDKERRNTILNCYMFRTRFKDHPELHHDVIVFRAILKRYPESLQYIEVPTTEQCEIAFAADKNTIEWIPDSFKTADMCYKAVEANAEFLKYIPAPFLTPRLYQQALSINPSILQFIPEPSFDILDKALTRNEELKQNNHRHYCKNVWSYIPAHWKTDSFYTWVHLNFPSHVTYPSEEFQICLRMLALHRNPSHIRYFLEPEPSEFEWLTVLKVEPYLLKHASSTFRKNSEFQKNAVQREPLCLEFCLDPSKDVCMLAVKPNGNALKYISLKMQTEHPELVRTALTQTKDALKYAKIALADQPATWICGTQADSELLFPEASEDLRKRSLEDPDTLEPLQKGEVYGFWLDDEKRWYVAGSRTMFRRFIETKYKGSTMYQVYVPLLKNVMNVQNLQWVVW